MNKKFVTAKELANYFEVSQRTIYRDIEILNVAGIPVYTNKGKGGGIKMLDNFLLNKSVLSEQEQNEILTALQSVKALKQSNQLAQLNPENVITKLSAIFTRDVINWVEMDFSDWSFSFTGKDYFDIIKSSILNKKCIAFDYFSTKGEKSQRNIYPITLWFKHKSWYVKAFCLTKNSYRVFKLSRIKNLSVTEEKFEIYKISDMQFYEEEREEQSIIKGDVIKIKLYINASMAYRVYDEFDEDCIEKDADGNFIVYASYPEDEWLYGYILSFNHNAEVLEPLYFRNTIRERLKSALSNYTR
jgi:predicted DNA-binding transcriptional regulator YafY